MREPPSYLKDANLDTYGLKVFPELYESKVRPVLHSQTWQT